MSASQDDYFAPVKRVGIAALSVLAVFGGAAAALAQEGPVRANNAPWILNQDGEKSKHMVVRQMEPPPPQLSGQQGTGEQAATRLRTKSKPPKNLDEPARVNVHSAEAQGAYTKLTTQYIPNYRVEFSEALENALKARPKFDSEFPNGIRPKLGDVIDFGDDIGYSGGVCASGHGKGYWPPATFCADANVAELYLPNKPAPTKDVCYTTLGSVGLFLNGTAVFNWSDAQSYKYQEVWHNAAPVFERYDFDICSGHAAAGLYHHHTFTPCLARLFKDDGKAHSPVWGFAADGYPIHGPWQGPNQLAQSCWKTRLYQSGSPTGCGKDRVRNCILVDNEDPAKGVQTVELAPPVGAQIESLFSKNPLAANSGSYFEDFYFDRACAKGGGAALDANNGHAHGGLGYHYHLTVDQAMKPVFPYSFGPRYYGVLHDNSWTPCGAKPLDRSRMGPDGIKRGESAPPNSPNWVEVDAARLADRF